MAEAAQGTQQEFWRPPSPSVADAGIVLPSAPAMAAACNHCGTEFLTGSRFCHACGRKRLEASAILTDGEITTIWKQTVNIAQASLTAWRKIEFPSWLRYLHFHEIKSRVGLPTASLIAFMIGLGCVAGALLVGLLNARNFVDWQAIQFYRGEWLLAATAAFVAGILLKNPSDRNTD